jgi:cell division protein FtsW
MMGKVKEWTDKHLQGDPIIWAVVIALSLVSILVVYSATGTLAFKRMSNPESYLIKHTLLVGLGLVAMWVAHKIDYRYFYKISRLALWISIPLLLYTFTNGTDINEARRWITLPLVNATFQPSDLASLALIMNLAGMLSKRQQKIEDVKSSLVPMLLWCGAICLLIGLTNLSSAILLFVTCMVILFIGRVPVRYLAMLSLVGVLAGAAALQLGVRKETAMNRIESFMNDDELPFQAKHARIAVATGGITGKGPGNSQQRNILPHPYSDFVFAIIVEEYGLIGGGFVLAMYLTLLFRGMRAVDMSQRAYGGLLSAGLSFAIVMQAMINMGVVVGLGPVTGLPLPMVSMGGTSLLFTGLSLGIILSVSRGEVDSEIKTKKDTGKNTAKVAW